MRKPAKSPSKPFIVRGASVPAMARAAIVRKVKREMAGQIGAAGALREPDGKLLAEHTATGSGKVKLSKKGPRPLTKTERITVLVPQKLKAGLARQARKEGVSLSELVRRRCLSPSGHDDQLLRALADQLRSLTAEANASLSAGIASTHRALGEIRAKRSS